MPGDFGIRSSAPAATGPFLCPLITNGEAGGARVKKLYLPPGARHFGCRGCYHLTYTSCQIQGTRFEGMLSGVFGRGSVRAR
jgi:hypothetical protein